MIYVEVVHFFTINMPKVRYMGFLTLDADFYLCHRFSLFIIRNFGDIASRPNKNYISLPAEFSEVFWHFLAAYANKNNARFQLSEDEV